MDLADKQYRFQCTECGYCCRFEPGFVFLTRSDLIRFAKYKNISVSEFISLYCREVNGSEGRRISLKELKNHDCLFWKEGCTVYEARPGQCRSYPFWSSIMDNQNSWKKEATYCPGIGKGPVLDKSFVQEKRLLRDEPLISWDDACKIG